ncbi:MAG: peptide chain release factor N(5)-glutamine methyltransferase [Patescibacteria group bacterium]
MNIKNTLFYTASKLHKYSPTSDLDAEIFVSFVISKPREFLYTYPEKELTAFQLKKLNQFIDRRLNNEPVAYIVGQKEFYGLDFIVNKNVLIPRPDTEILVDQILKIKNDKFKMIDMGTGSGCVAIALKKLLPQANIIASDISNSALTIARKNAKFNLCDIKFYCSDLFDKIPQNIYHNNFDIIIFNPPYLTKNEAKKKNLKHEPQIALTPKNFTALINKFFLQSKSFISNDGYFFIEIGHRQASLIKKIALRYCPKAKIVVIKDLGGFDRVVKIKI